MTAPLADTGIDALYIHVPFCERRCEYCDFASVAGLRGHAEYVEALRAQLRATAAALPGVRLRSVFVGGGTPGLLPPPLLRSVLDEMRGGFALEPGCEVTIEANPSSTSAARATAWLEAGVNRVSLGVQSLDPATLRFLGRVHDAHRALAALAELRDAGVPRRSADLIYAVPTLSDAAWRDTVEGVLAHDCGHLSAYELTVEAGTPLAAEVEAGRVEPVDAETSLRQHWMVVDLAARAGYAQYEVSNFARPGEECRHNLAYWGNRFYIAVGVGAHGHLPPAAGAALGIAEAAAPGAVAVRYWHDREPAAYREAVSRHPAAPMAGAEAVGPSAAAAERLMVGLRLNRGVVVPEAALEAAEALARSGLLVLEGPVARATERGQEVLNGVALRLVEAAAG